MKLILGDNSIEWSLPQTIARQTIDQIKEDMRNKVDQNTRIQNAIDFIQDTDWYKTLKPIERDIINRKNLKILLENGVKNEPAKHKNMKIEIDRILELIKIALLLIIVILLSLSYYGGGSVSKYEIYGDGRFRLNKETGETYQCKEINNNLEYVKIKIKE